MEYYFTPKENVDLKNNLILIEDFEYRHLAKVLRKKTGDKISVTDGLLNVYHCRINEIDKKKIVCDILKQEFNVNEPAVKLSLYISPLRNPSRLEFAIEKCVELGVNSIHTVITHNTVSKNEINASRKERLKKIIIGAMGQSQRCFLPEFNDAIKFDEMIVKTSKEKNKVVMYEGSENYSGFESENENANISLLIGPEGGFTSEEIEKLSRNGWQIKSLGKRKLRAETAAVIAVSELLK